MKTVKIDELNNYKLERNDEYIKNQIQKAKDFSKEVSQHYGNETLIDLSEQDGKLYYERSECKLNHEYLELRINYRKKYYISCPSIPKLKNVSHYTVTEQEKKLVKPNDIGVLNTKKIQQWIKYYEALYYACEQIDTANLMKKTTFLHELRDLTKDLEIKWFKDGTQGEIEKNGIIFKFEINEEYISKKIELSYKVENDLQSFLNLADNKLTTQPE